MDNEKLLWDIESELEIFQAHVMRMRKNSGKLHTLDVELLQEKTRKLYDKLICLAEASSEKEKINAAPEYKEEKAPKPEVTAEDTFVEVKEETKQLEEPVIVDEAEDEPETILEPQEEFSEVKIEQEGVEPDPPVVSFKEPEKVELEKQPVTVIEETIEVEPSVPTASSRQPESESGNETKKVVRSTIDLFSETVEETIADKFGSTNDSSIAKKMQQSQIDDLRQAIGINEKFLFINGLFNGDLSRYNKAIDEFNELKTKEGVNAHFLELKIHNQWSDDNDGAVKLKALLDRKFS
jgi:hypothetical protein